MIKVDKVMMIVWRENNGTKEYFVVHRKKGDNVIPTGHVEKGETLEQAAAREAQEEFGVKPLSVCKIDYSVTVLLENKTKQSTEYAFMVELPNQHIEYLENNESGKWHKLDELSDILTYKSQIGAIKAINQI